MDTVSFAQPNTFATVRCCQSSFSKFLSTYDLELILTYLRTQSHIMEPKPGEKGGRGQEGPQHNNLTCLKVMTLLLKWCYWNISWQSCLLWERWLTALGNINISLWEMFYGMSNYILFWNTPRMCWFSLTCLFIHLPRLSLAHYIFSFQRCYDSFSCLVLKQNWNALPQRNCCLILSKAPRNLEKKRKKTFTK